MKILIVEDEVLLANSLKTLLEKKGFTVEVAYDGETGKDYAETGVYDLLILDVMMPKLNGYDLARQVRAERCASTNGTSSSKTTAAARKMPGVGTVLTTPSSIYVLSELRMTAAPSDGPRIIGSSTPKIMRMP